MSEPTRQEKIETLLTEAKTAFDAVAPLLADYQAGRLKLNEVLHPLQGHLMIIVSKTGDLWQDIKVENSPEEREQVIEDATMAVLAVAKIDLPGPDIVWVKAAIKFATWGWRLSRDTRRAEEARL